MVPQLQSSSHTRTFDHQSAGQSLEVSYSQEARCQPRTTRLRLPCSNARRQVLSTTVQHPGADEWQTSFLFPVPCSDVQFGSANILADPILREGIKKYTSWPTIPQVRLRLANV